MKKVTLFAGVLMLAACGGGGGGGAVGGRDGIGIAGGVRIPSHDVVVDADVIESNKKLLTMQSSIADESARTVYLKKALSAPGYDGYVKDLRKAQRCNTDTECNQAIFNEMTKILQGLDAGTYVVDDSSVTNVRRALWIAGYKIPKATEDSKVLKEWIEQNKGTFAETADKVSSRPELKEPKHFWLDSASFRALLTTGGADKMVLDIDDKGEITGVKFVDTGSGSSNSNPAVFYSFMKRAGTNENEFDATSDTTKGQLVMESYAKDLNLKYADFGVLTYKGTIGTDEREFNIPFMGGYDAKKISKYELESDVTFAGTAKGAVNSSNGAKNLTLEGENNATLVFNKEDGIETFNAAFANWYDVTATKKAGGKVEITFVEKDGISEDYKFAETKGNKAVFETAYYGDYNDASEATALIQYQGKAKNPQDDGNINMFLGFGGKKAE